MYNIRTVLQIMFSCMLIDIYSYLFVTFFLFLPLLFDVLWSSGVSDDEIQGGYPKFSDIDLEAERRYAAILGIVMAIDYNLQVNSLQKQEGCFNPTCLPQL